MKKAFAVMLLFALLGSIDTTLFAAELLYVKPIVAGNSVYIEISADIAMTYKYYNLPGQTRAVVDIAEAGPEKIEPLIVVNKGVVSNISVDSAKISGIVASRIVFNLTSEANISVTASPDLKLLVVTFGGLTSAVPKAERMPKLEPVVPAETATELPLVLTIKEIVTGVLSVEIHTNQPVTDYKMMKLSNPDRLVIDIPCKKADQRRNVTTINRFGISKVRIGVSPGNIRIVMDSSKAGFPAHTITKTEYGLRINFNQDNVAQ